MSSPSVDNHVRIRMYRQGLGDCFLLTFPRTVAPGEVGTGAFHMLIDCGVLLGTSDASDVMKRVVQDIFTATGGHLNLLVGTHEHWDHLSGFIQARDLFDTFRIDTIWLGWTEDPNNPDALALQQGRAAKLSAISAAVKRIEHSAFSQISEQERESIQRVMEFFGPLPDGETSGAGEGLSLSESQRGTKTSDALNYLRTRQDSQVHYCHPSKEGPHSLDGVDGVRIYVFGPPEDPVLLKMSDATRKGRETYGALAPNEESSFLASLFPASGSQGGNTYYKQIQELCFPFDSFYQVERSEAALDPFFRQFYGFNANEGDVWRRIDEDWLDVTSKLALNLDSDTNNTSLVLAIELGQPGQGKVLLFTADAQVGNWLSWGRLSWSVVPATNVPPVQVTAHDLLAHTVLYKVGHHGSHNATLRADGLERMISEDLVALIPVDEDMAVKKRWVMPFPDLYDTLKQKSRGRVIRIDNGMPTRAETSALTEAQWQRFCNSVQQTDLYIDYFIPIS